MATRHATSTLLGLAVLAGATASSLAQTFIGLGVLPGGTGSRATAVSANGSVVVGIAQFTTESQTRALRGTSLAGMVSLGSLPGGNESIANGVNSDGSVVVGWGNDSGNNGVGFRWTNPATGGT